MKTCPNCGAPMNINRLPGYEVWRLPNFMNIYQKSKEETMKFYDGITVDAALPQQWLYDFAEATGTDYDLVLQGFCWGYAEGDPIGEPLPLFHEASLWLLGYNARNKALGNA